MEGEPREEDTRVVADTGEGTTAPTTNTTVQVPFGSWRDDGPAGASDEREDGSSETARGVEHVSP